MRTILFILYKKSKRNSEFYTGKDLILWLCHERKDNLSDDERIWLQGAEIDSHAAKVSYVLLEMEIFKHIQWLANHITTQVRKLMKSSIAPSRRWMKKKNMGISFLV